MEIDDLPNDKHKEFNSDFRFSKKAAYLVQRFGFPMMYVKDQMEKNATNFCTTVYYLMIKD